MIELKLEINDVNLLLHALGELPAKTNAWNLIMNIKQQADPQAEAIMKTNNEVTNE
jgi:hypothetical protein